MCSVKCNNNLNRKKKIAGISREFLSKRKLKNNYKLIYLKPKRIIQKNIGLFILVSIVPQKNIALLGYREAIKSIDSKILC